MIPLKLLDLWNRIIPESDDRALFVSFPDLSDNAFAYFLHHIRTAGGSFKYIWLVSEERRELYEKMVDSYFGASEWRRVARFVPKRSFRGMWSYIRAKEIYFTHGFYTGLKSAGGQRRIYLSHGMPLKAVGHLNRFGDPKTIPHSDYAIATSPFFQKIVARAFGLPKERVLVTGLPRNDLLFESKGCLERFGLPKGKKIIFWAPTFRRALGKEMKDGRFDGGLPLLGRDLTNFDRFLGGLDVHLLVKLHPMDRLNRSDFDSYENITVIKNEDLLQKGCQLYSLLGQTDLLITDYSSIYVDYLLLDRPVVFAMNDLDEYRRSRDFVVDDPLQYMPGPIVKDAKGLKTALGKALEKDLYSSERARLCDLFHTHRRDFSKRLYERLARIDAD